MAASDWVVNHNLSRFDASAGGENLDGVSPRSGWFEKKRTQVALGGAVRRSALGNKETLRVTSQPQSPKEWWSLLYASVEVAVCGE